MKFKKIYIEITNSCNFDCSFCFKTSRTTKFMSPDEFRTIIEKISPYTNYVYLHVLGEPLLHPKLEEIISIAESANININLTTNGGLLEQKKEILLKHNIRQINISLHDAEENIAIDNWNNYLESALNFSTEIAHKTYVSLRLWNTTNLASAEFNQLFLNRIGEKFNIDIQSLDENSKSNGIKLSNHIFLQRGPRFEWPEEKKAGEHNQKTCFALRDHIAILANGEVVPCCLDADANIKLGNIFTDELSEILATDRAKNIKKGFEQRKIVEPLCASCGFIID